MAKTITFKSNTYGPRTLYLRLTQTPDIATNTSKIDWTFSSEGSNSSASLFLVYATTIKINGEQVYYKDDTPWYGNGTTENPRRVFPAAEGSKSGSVTVRHNNDGTLTIPIYFYTGVYASKYKANYGGNWTLDTIPRGATMSSAPNFNDEENPTISYSSPAGNAVTELVAGIYNDAGSVSYAGYRDISKTGSSYTFNLTTAERNALRNATPNSNTMTVRFYIRTNIGGNHFYSSIAKTLTIKNPNPTLSPTVVDTNETTKALTGDANKLIRYYSNAQYSIGASAIKGASLSSQKVTHNGSSKTTATGTYNAVENGSFVFEAKDSRGNTTTKTITKTMINYVRLTANFKPRINVAGEATLNISGNYFNGSFGAVNNTLTVQYRYKKEGGSYSSWTNATASLSGNTYTAAPVITGLNYQDAYVFQVRATDKLATSTTGEITTKALPVFDWGKDDFHIHGNLLVEGTIVGNNATAATTLGEDGAVDYIIEQGNNGSYAYRKWNNGLIEAWRSAASSISVTASETSGPIYYTTQTTLRTNGYASQFISLENVQVSVNKNGAVGFWQPVIARTNVEDGQASADVFFTNTVKDATASIQPYIYFTGRWK